MPRNRDMPCAECGGLMWRSHSSLPAGLARCHPCRRRSTGTEKMRTDSFICQREGCGQEFQRAWRPGASKPKYCGQRCAAITHCSSDGQRARKRDNRTTPQRGYGYAHQQARLKFLAQLEDGDLCHHCNQPMTRDQALDLDHTTDRSTYRGLAHASCNRTDGARRGNQQRRTPSSRDW
jgi:hypothetical protein